MTAEAIVDIRNALAQTFNEALKTHGPALALAGAACHAQLDHLNRECDEQQQQDRLLDRPAGLA